MTGKQQIVTIDGPSGVGKSTVSRVIASRLGFTYLDTGAMYRGVALYFNRCNVEITNAEIAPRLVDVEIELLPATIAEDDVGVLLNGEDVSQEIRTPEMSMVASAISALPSVRGFLTEMQRKLADAGKIVAEGRDMGTIVFPAAEYKFFLDADPKERCRRRVDQLQKRGMEADADKILQMIIERDKQDSERAIAPLKKAEDATLINTTTLSIDQVCSKIMETIQQKTR